MKIIINEDKIPLIEPLLKESPAGIINTLRTSIKNVGKRLFKNPVETILDNLRNTDTITGKSWEGIFRNLIQSNRFDTIIRVGNLRGRVTNPRQLSRLFSSGRLSDKDAALIIQTIINNTIKDTDVLKFAKYITSKDKTLKTSLKGLSENEIILRLKTNGFNSRAAKAIAKEVHQSAKFGGGIGVWKGIQEWSKSPKLYQLFFNKSIDGQSRQKILLKWLLTGTTRKDLRKYLKEVVKSFKDEGISIEGAKPFIKMLTSFSTEAILRWITLNVFLMFIDWGVSIWKESGGPEMDKRMDESTFSLLWQDFIDHLKTTPFGWVIPAKTVLPAVWDIFDGLLRRKTPLQIWEDMRAGILPEQQELETINNQMTSVIETETELDSQIKDLYDSDSPKPEISSDVDQSIFPLKIGSKGPEVTKLQTFLNQMVPQPPLKVTGVYDQKTKDKLDIFKNLTNEKFN